MNFLKRYGPRLLAIGLIALSINSCKKFSGDVRVPAYLQLDGIDIVQQMYNAPSNDPGFYSSLVDAVQLIYLFDGDEAETVAGVFQLPCTVPVLRSGTMKYLRVVPVVKQDGIAGTRIAYPFYKPVELNGVHIAADSITHLGSLDTARGGWYLQAHYYPKGDNAITVWAEDYFEPINLTTHFDSTLTIVKNDTAGACTGQGYGQLLIPDTCTTASLYMETRIAPSSGDYLYLEMDYKTDFELYINLLGYSSVGGTLSTKSVMCLVPNTKWQKIYINLGRTWRQFNYNTPLYLYMQAANPDGKSGRVLLDNVKVISM